jgi:hypothetical protein
VSCFALGAGAPHAGRHDDCGDPDCVLVIPSYCYLSKALDEMAESRGTSLVEFTPDVVASLRRVLNKAVRALASSCDMPVAELVHIVRSPPPSGLSVQQMHMRMVERLRSVEFAACAAVPVGRLLSRSPLEPAPAFVDLLNRRQQQRVVADAAVGSATNAASSASSASGSRKRSLSSVPLVRNIDLQRPRLELEDPTDPSLSRAESENILRFNDDYRDQLSAENVSTGVGIGNYPSIGARELRLDSWTMGALHRRAASASSLACTTMLDLCSVVRFESGMSTTKAQQPTGLRRSS